MYNVWNQHLVWIAPTAQIGDGTSVGNFTEIGDEAIVGNNCKIQAFVFIPKGVVIGNEVFIGPNTVFTNDRYPKCSDYGLFQKTIIEDGVAIGAGSVIRCGVTIGRGAVIGAGSVVTHDVPPGETWYGNPARRSR